MIKKHMFPLNPAPPRFKETAVLCLADKYCALRETVLQRKKRISENSKSSRGENLRELFV